MTVEEVYRCDVTDERFDDTTDLIEFDVVRRRSNGWDTWSRTHHVHDELIESHVKPTSVERVFVERDEEDVEVVAYMASIGHNDNPKFRELDDFMTGVSDRQLFELIEEELL